MDPDQTAPMGAVWSGFIFLFFFYFYYLYFIVNMSYKIQYIIMHLLQSKHTLSMFLRFALISAFFCIPNLSTNLSVHVVKCFQLKVGSKISFKLTWYYMYFLFIAIMELYDFTYLLVLMSHLLLKKLYSHEATIIYSITSSTTIFHWHTNNII